MSPANYPDFTKFANATSLDDAVGRLYAECAKPSEPQDNKTVSTTSDLGQCKIAAVQRLVDSPIDFVEGDVDKCEAVWVPGDEAGKGRIQVTHRKGVDCSQDFPTDRKKRIDVALQTAYSNDLKAAFEDLDDLATLAARLYGFCDTTLGVEDPADCKKKQLKLLTSPIEESVTANCPTIDDRPSGPVLIFNTSCSAKFKFDNDDARELEVEKGIAAYKENQPATLKKLVEDLYRACAARQEQASFTNVLPCWERARTVGAETPYEFAKGEPGCRASLDSAGTHIILTGDRASCDQAFPKNGDARGAAVIDGGKSYEQVAALSGAKDVADALKKLYAFCDSGKGGDPATCKQEGKDELLKIEVQRSDEADCTARVRIIDGKATIEVGENCDTAFPSGTAGWPDAVNNAAAAEDKDAALSAATDLPSAKAALYAFCDSGKGGDPAACKKDADALLGAPILRTGTSCTPAITTVDGKSAIVVGPKCDKQFPDDPALRAAAIDEASKKSQLAAALRGTTDLTAAAKALYAFCDSGAQGDPAACKKSADELLQDTQVVRAGDKCTADVSTDKGKPVIVVGKECAATAFPNDDKAKAKALQEAAAPNAPAQLAPPNEVVPQQNPAGAPTSTSAPADAPPVEKPVAPKVETPPAAKVETPPVEKKKEENAPPKEEPAKKESDQTVTKN